MGTPNAELPRREQESELTHGGRVLTITVWRQGRVRKDGEVSLRPLTTVYFVERLGPGEVRLVKEDGEENYRVTANHCECQDTKYRGRQVICKHRSAAEEHGLLGAGPPDAAAGVELHRTQAR